MPGLLNYEALEPVCYSEAHELPPGSLSSLQILPTHRYLVQLTAGDRGLSPLTHFLPRGPSCLVPRSPPQISGPAKAIYEHVWSLSASGLCSLLTQLGPPSQIPQDRLRDVPPPEAFFDLLS